MSEPKTMMINEVEYARKDSVAPMIQSSDLGPWQIGKCYLFRLVSLYDTGRLVAVTPTELVIEDAAWIADTGRFADALKSVEFCEVEPFPSGRVIIGRGAVVDAVEIATCPRKQK